MRIQGHRGTLPQISQPLGPEVAKFPHSPILYYACRSMVTENNGKNNATAVGLDAVLLFLGGETKD